MLGWIRATLGFDARPTASPSPADGRSAVQFSDYRVRAMFRRRTSTHIDNWYPATHPDEAVVLARRRYPTADAWEYLGERRDLSAAEVEILRRANTGK